MAAEIIGSFLYHYAEHLMFARTLPALLAVASIPSAIAASPVLDRQFSQTVQPFVTKYCIGCHSGKLPAASLDLKSYTTADSVARDYSRWVLVHDKLTAKAMPPKQVPQPPAEVSQQVIDWIQALRAEELKKNAGDPGVVLTRRLSNAEYDYTIRDLTGVDLRPAREFPVDPANPEGFDNSGESLSMSPALLKKYLQAAREVGDNMVLTPDGFDFATHPMLVETDRDKYAIERIVNFYKSQPTDYADYFQAAWRFKNRAALGKPNATLASTAADAKLSPKYLPMVWQILEEPKNVVGPIAKLQEMWHDLPAPGGDRAVLRAQCVEMRDFVVRIRKHTAMTFAAPKVRGLSPTSQPLMNWKLKEFAANRRNFDPATLRNEDDPPPTIPTLPRMPGLGQEAANRWALVAFKARADDTDLIVPTGQRADYEAAFARFSSVFPDAFYISERGRFYPDDSEDKGRLLSAGFHNVMGYYRDDTPLIELILDDKGKKELDRLWVEFEFIADYTTRTYNQYYFNQSGEVQGKGRESGTFRPQDKDITSQEVIFGLRSAYLAKADAPGNDPVAMQAIKEHFERVNSTIRGIEQLRVAAEPKHIDALLRFAARAYRRPLSKAERDDLVAYYHTLRDKNSLSHEDAIRASIVSVLMSPDFCYRLDLSPAAAQSNIIRTSSAIPASPLSGYALASRLSYFLWSSMPDDELLRHAAAGDLQRPDVLVAQTRRMLKDPRVSGLATEFGGNWLDFRHFEQYNSVDRDRFPTFNNDLREAMFQEPVHMLESVIQNDASALDLLYGNYTYVNQPLAKHYGIPWDPDNAPDAWVRVDDAGRYQRGGLLPMAVFLTQNSPGLRTSPVKRGYWVVHRVLGETIPPPPPVVPELPNDEAMSDRPLREMLAQHRANPVCAGCHARFDVFGLAFEAYGPVGEARTNDLAGRPVDTNAVFPGGSQGSGYEGVETFIRENRQPEFLGNLSHKLLAYALNRSLQLSDEAVVDRMNSRMAANNCKISTLVETIVTSPQFLNKRAVVMHVAARQQTASPVRPQQKKGE
jgi:Protein of unknown function (DUF1592)/Protein of unknown function (DUF1588)/Protein of unknown function (DUF1587)/Protein of unknown function (DUF1595)/Protein of unknown function (DUF1585)